MSRLRYNVPEMVAALQVALDWLETEHEHEEIVGDRAHYHECTPDTCGDAPLVMEQCRAALKNARGMWSRRLWDRLLDI